MTKRKSKVSVRDAAPALEWAAAAAGLLILLGLSFILIREASDGNDRVVPILEANIEQITPTPAGFVADVVVYNRSRQTAAAVQVEGKLGDEQASATLDYVPGRSEARGGLIFRSDPRSGGVELSIVGFELP